MTQVFLIDTPVSGSYTMLPDFLENMPSWKDNFHTVNISIAEKKWKEAIKTPYVVLRKNNNR